MSQGVSTDLPKFGVLTTYTTVYSQTCSTGLEEVTYTVTESCSNSGQPREASYVPQGFMVTIVSCTVCGEKPLVATLTTPAPLAATPGAGSGPNPAPAAPTGSSPKALAGPYPAPGSAPPAGGVPANGSYAPASSGSVPASGGSAPASGGSAPAVGGAAPAGGAPDSGGAPAPAPAPAAAPAAAAGKAPAAAGTPPPLFATPTTKGRAGAAATGASAVGSSAPGTSPVQFTGTASSLSVSLAAGLAMFVGALGLNL